MTGIRKDRNDNRWRARLSGIGVGMLIGGMMGGVLSAWVTVVRIFGGTSAFAELHTTYPAVVATYMVCGVGVGALAGLLGPLVRGRWSAAVLGSVVAFPVAVAIRMARYGLTPWGGADVFTTVGFTLAFGPALGIFFWRLMRGE